MNDPTVFQGSRGRRPQARLTRREKESCAHAVFSTRVRTIDNDERMYTQSISVELLLEAEWNANRVRARCAVRRVFPSASLEREGKAHACPALAAADVDAVG
jgi:hypothetical protein